MDIPEPNYRFQLAVEETHAHPLNQPLRVGSFYCHASLARGGQGSVYLATGDPEARSQVCVVKVFHNTDEATLRRARRSIEAQLHVIDDPGLGPDRPSRSAPRHVPAILSWDLSPERAWVVQAYRGPNLRIHRREGAATWRPEQIRRDTGADPDHCWDLTPALTRAVSAMHRRGVIHRDLKPENVLVEWEPRGSSRVYLCDFDLARAHDQSTLTTTGVGMGTLGYSAPEQLLGRGADEASDVYALAGLLVFLHTGLDPVNAMTTNDPLHPQLLPNVLTQLDGLADWVSAAFAFDPTERPGAYDMPTMRIRYPYRSSRNAGEDLRAEVIYGESFRTAGARIDAHFRERQREHEARATETEADFLARIDRTIGYGQQRKTRPDTSPSDPQGQ